MPHSTGEYTSPVWALDKKKAFAGDLDLVDCRRPGLSLMVKVFVLLLFQEMSLDSILLLQITLGLNRNADKLAMNSYCVWFVCLCVYV